MNKITYVTGNWAKIASAKQALEPIGYEIDNIMVKGFDKEIDAKNYFLELDKLVNNNNLKELISIFKDNIS